MHIARALSASKISSKYTYIYVYTNNKPLCTPYLREVSDQAGGLDWALAVGAGHGNDGTQQFNRAAPNLQQGVMFMPRVCHLTSDFGSTHNKIHILYLYF